MFGAKAMSGLFGSGGPAAMVNRFLFGPNAPAMPVSPEAGLSVRPLPEFTRDVTFFTAAIGRAIIATCDQSGCTSSLLRTSDGGSTWVRDSAQIAAAYQSSVVFVSPEHAWLLSEQGGGLTSAFSQALYAYAGAEPNLTNTPRRIVAPDSGTGDGRGADSLGLPIVALIASGAGLAGIGAWLRQRRQRDRRP